MKKNRIYQERQVNATTWFWFLAVIGLLTRLPLLGLSAAETTDGILSLTYFSPDHVATPRFVIMPLYPGLLWLGQKIGWTGWVWGRALAALAGLLFLIPLWKFSRRWLTVEMSAVVCLMALFSPLLWQWSLKVMPDTLFLLFFWWGVERLVTVSIERKPGAWVEACFYGAIATATRAEGLLLLPWLLFLGSKMANPSAWKRQWAGWLAGLALVGLVWAAPLNALYHRFLTILSAYQEGAGMPINGTQVEYPLLNFIDHFYAYLSQPLYVFTPLVFWFAVLGLAKMVRREDATGNAFKLVILPIFGLVFLSRLIPTQYQDRHMLPFLPLLLVAAGFQLEHFFGSLDKGRNPIQLMFWKNGLLIFCLLWLAVFSVVVLIAQSDSFGDVKRSAEFLKTLPPNAVIYSDEVPKTQFWSGRKVRFIQLPFKPNAGDYIIYHSFYTARLGVVDMELRARHAAVQVHGEESMVVPLLTDIMSDPSLQNRIVSTAYRFQPQFFISSVYQVNK